MSSDGAEERIEDERLARVAISGKSGCGNSTVSRLVAEELGLRLINYTFRDMAREKGVSFEELHRMAEEDPSIDRELDRKQVRLASEPGCVLGSRLAIWVLEDADLKVYLEASPEVRAARVAEREGLPLEEALRKTNDRDRRDRARYRRLYDIDIDQYGFADIKVDAVALDQYGVASAIVAEVRARAGKRRS